MLFPGWYTHSQTYTRHSYCFTNNILILIFLWPKFFIMPQTFLWDNFPPLKTYPLEFYQKAVKYNFLNFCLKLKLLFTLESSVQSLSCVLKVRFAKFRIQSWDLFTVIILKRAELFFLASVATVGMSLSVFWPVFGRQFIFSLVPFLCVWSSAVWLW